MRDRRLAVTASTAWLGGGDLGDPVAETGSGLAHQEEGMLSVSRSPDAGATARVGGRRQATC